MYMYVCVCIHIYIYMYTCVCVYIYIYTYILLLLDIVFTVVGAGCTLQLKSAESPLVCGTLSNGWALCPAWFPKVSQAAQYVIYVAVRRRLYYVYEDTYVDLEARSGGAPSALSVYVYIYIYIYVYIYIYINK